VLEAERLGAHLKQLQQERKHHWEAWTNLQLAEQEASTRIAEHLGGGLNRAGGLLDAYGWSGTPLAFKIPTSDPPAPTEAALKGTRWWRQLRSSAQTRRQTPGPSPRPPERPATDDRLPSLSPRRPAESSLPSPPQAATPRLAVHLLGQFLATLDDVVVTKWPSRRGRELFKYLVTHRQPWLGREQMMEVFWPGSPPGRPATA
jgi:hypothetical protein